MWLFKTSMAHSVPDSKAFCDCSGCVLGIGEYSAKKILSFPMSEILTNFPFIYLPFLRKKC